MDMNYFNYGADDQVLGTPQDYKPEQYNTQGQNLSPTQPLNNAPITVDYSNDYRDALQFKQQAVQAQQDTLSVDDTTNKIIGKSGYLYQKVDDTRAGQMRTATAAFADAYFSHMNVDATALSGIAGVAASNAVRWHSKAAQRQTLINNLEDKGYNPLDIDKWIMTNNTKDLITNKGTWTSDGHGLMHNTLTGEVKSIPGYQDTVKTEHVDLGDRIAIVNSSTGEEINSIPKGVKPVHGSTGGSSGSGGGIGLDEPSNDGYVFENGQWVQHTTYANGTPKTLVANATLQKQLNSREAAKNPSATETLVNNDLDLLDKAVDSGKTDVFTGQLVGRSETAGDWMSSNKDQETRDAYQASNRIQGYMQNQGVGAAKAMGLSGINTMEEAKRAFASMPQLDKTSPEALKESVKSIRSYIQQYNDQSREQAGITNESTSTNKKDYSNMW